MMRLRIYWGVLKSYYELFGQISCQRLKKCKQQLLTKGAILNKKDNHSYPIKEMPFIIPENWEWVYLSIYQLFKKDQA